MREVLLADEVDLEGWRAAARGLLAAKVPAEAVRWQVGDAQASLFTSEAGNAEPEAVPVTVPRRFLDLAGQVIQHRDPGRFNLLYRLLLRLAGGERGLLERLVDNEVMRASSMAREVRRAGHKLKAFVRFKAVEVEGETRFLAWFEPEHYVLESASAFFAGRFTTMRWSIVTPYRSVHWDRETLSFGAGGRRAEVPAEDALDETWRAYYRAIFNPARLNLRAMQREMPKKYWRYMPEARAIRGMAADAAAKAAAMVAAAPTEPARKGRVVLLPHVQHRIVASAPRARRFTDLDAAQAAAAACRACPLWARGTQTVFGEGPRDAPIMLVGEQPGDQEDLAGRPFVGPAGEVLDKALADAGLERSGLYVTNAVKHFKHTLRGKRRLHQSPEAGEVELCRQWLDVERELVQPRLIVAMGVTAASALLRRTVTLQLERGRVMAFDGVSNILVTAHPSFILRIPDPAAQGREYRRLVHDLLLAAPYRRLAA